MKQLGREVKSCHGRYLHRQLQIQTPASAKQALPHNRHPNDYDRVAAVLLQMAMGAGSVRHRLDASVHWPCDRREPTCLLQKSNLSAGWPLVVRSPRGGSSWSSQAFHVKIAPRESGAE